jgi:hypothetical protein
MLDPDALGWIKDKNEWKLDVKEGGHWLKEVLPAEGYKVSR